MTQFGVCVTNGKLRTDHTAEVLCVKVFYYVPSALSGEILECGLKKTDWWERELEREGEQIRYMVAYLHPADSVYSQNPSYQAIRVDLTGETAYVAEGAVRDYPEWYEQSLIPLSSYRLGTYRKPECLISKTIFPNRLFAYDSRRGEPILYESSEALYLNGLKCQAIEIYEDFYELAMQAYYDKLVQQDIYEVISGDFTVYRKKNGGQLVTVRRPREIPGEA